MERKSAHTLIGAAIVAALVASPAAYAQRCTTELSAARTAQKPAATKLRFGIGPLVQAGQAGGGPAPAVPERPGETERALAQLKAPGRPFVLRLNRFLWSDGEAGFRRYLGLARRFVRLGYLVELQVRYHPSAAQEGDLAAWRAHVREVVRRFGRIRRVIALQIANEVNMTVSPDSSDGAYERAPEALVQGVIAAKREVRRLHLAHLKIGFNWFSRLDPATEQRFWAGLRNRAFARSVDWIGLDAYPGTVFPSSVPLAGTRDAIVTALSSIRCFAREAGIGRRVPIRVEENGYPTQPPLRSYPDQARRLDAMVRAVNAFRGTYNVSDYRWFNLRDADTTSTVLFQHFGLLGSDYERKPAFAVYRRLVRALG
jgi:hypothetical protein